MKRLTIKKTDAGVQAYSEIHLRDFIKTIDVDATTKSVSAEIEKQTQSRLKTVGLLLDESINSSKTFHALAMFMEDVDSGVYGADQKGPRVSTASLRATFQRVKEDMTGLAGTDKRQLSHVGISNISIHLYAFYVELRRVGAAIKWSEVGTVETGGKETAVFKTVQNTLPDGRPIEGTKQVPKVSKKRALNQSQYNSFTEDIRHLYIMAKAIAEMPINKFTSSPYRDMSRALNDYFGKGQTHHFIGKEQTVNVASGKADAELVFEEQGDRSTLEYLIGFDKMSMILGEQRENTIKNIRNRFKNDFSKLAGSSTIKEDVIKGLSEKLVTGKTKTRKHKSKYTNKKKTKKPARAKKVETDISKSLTKAALVAAAFNKVPTPGKGAVAGQKPKRGADEEQLSPKQLGYLKRKINTRLPQQVEENMGRPALIYQTGRFANSTRLVDLKQGDKNLVGKYTYMLNPYETFENTGRYRWPTGYNPKPLISNSIRELAEQYTNKKFTLRRQ